MTDLARVAGVIVRGHQVASGAAAHSPYPQGTIALQVPIFRQFGLDLTDLFPGTLNVSIQPYQFRLVAPEVTFRGVTWTDRHPPEDFSFCRCRVQVQDAAYNGWIYYPHPETKQRHFQEPSLLEILAPWIANIQYGCPVELEYDPAAMVITPG